MSKPRYKWWSYVKWCIRDYPAKCAELKDLHEQSITANYNAMPHGTEVSRTTEQIALIGFGGQKQKEYEAVRDAIDATSELKMKVIDAVLISQTHTIAGAALMCHVEEITAKRYHGEFIRLVAKNMGLLD